MPYASNFAINNLWFMQSKALDRSVKAAPTYFFLSRAFSIFLSLYLSIAQCYGPFGTQIDRGERCVSINANNWLYISLSNNFDTMGSRLTGL